MPRYYRKTSGTRWVFVHPEVSRAFWSRRRAMHGDKVKLHIETRFVPDDTPVSVQIWEDDSGEHTPDDFIVELDGEHKIANNKCIIDHTVQWDPDTLGKEMALEGDCLEFYFLVKVESLELEKRSGLLLVDLINHSGSD
jgi:hypothetical protein